MSNLFEQYQNHKISQTIENKLSEITNALNNESYDEIQRASLLSYQQLIQIIKANLSSRILPMVPNAILDNLEVAVSNLSINLLPYMDRSISQYTQLMDWFKRIPTIEKKSEVKESLNQIIENFTNKQNKISETIDDEINDFKSIKTEELDSWHEEKSAMQKEIEQLKQDKIELEDDVKNLSQQIVNQENKMNELISNFQNDYETNRDDFEERFTEQEKELSIKIENLLSEQKNNAKATLDHLERRKDEIEKLWGIIGQAAISGNSQNYANKARNMANGLMVLTLIFMAVGLLYIGIATIALFKGEIHYIDFVWKVLTSAVILVPTFYTANLSKRQRDREFQLRDFEVKTACFEAFIESLEMNGDSNSKDQLKLELTKAFFKDQYSNSNNNDCVLIPREIAKILNNIAKKGNFNFNIGNNNEQDS